MNPENTQSNPSVSQVPAQTQTNVTSQKPKKGFPVKTLLLILVLFLITGGLVAFALMPKPQPVVEKKIVAPQIVEQTTLTVSSVPRPQATPSAYTTDILINTGQNSVISVQIELSYDPLVLTKVDIKTGSFLDNPTVALKNIDQKNGRITFALQVPDNEQGVLGQGVLATLSFSTIPGSSKEPTAINFEPKTQVMAEGYSESVLKSSVGALLSLGLVPSLKPSPTASPTATPEL